MGQGLGQMTRFREVHAVHPWVMGGLVGDFSFENFENPLYFFKVKIAKEMPF